MIFKETDINARDVCRRLKILKKTEGAMKKAHINMKTINEVMNFKVIFIPDFNNYGQCFGWPRVIFIHDELRKHRNEFIKVFIHELAHALDYFLGELYVKSKNYEHYDDDDNYPGHGQRWKMIMSLIFSRPDSELIIPHPNPKETLKMNEYCWYKQKMAVYFECNMKLNENNTENKKRKNEKSGDNN